MITSMTNKQVKKASSYTNKRKRIEDGCFVVYGLTLVEEAIEFGTVEQIFVTEEINLNTTVETLLVSQPVMKKICGGANSKVAAVCRIEKRDFTAGSVLVLDNVQDPGNLGTMLRSAKAFGINNILIGHGCVDVYNDKTVRSMHGVNFHLNIVHEDIETYLAKSNNKLITTYLDEDTDGFSALEASSAFDIIFGNEGHGIDPKYKQFNHHNIKLDIEFESLNVAIASSIIMYKLKEL